MSKICLNNPYNSQNYLLTSSIDPNTARIEAITFQQNNTPHSFSPISFKSSQMMGKNYSFYPFDESPNQTTVLQRLFPENIKLLAGNKSTIVSIANFSPWDHFTLQQQRAQSLVLTSCLTSDFKNQLTKFLKLQITFTVNWLNEFIMNVIFENLLEDSHNTIDLGLQFSFAPHLWILTDEHSDDEISLQNKEQIKQVSDLFQWKLQRDKIMLLSSNPLKLQCSPVGSLRYWHFNPSTFNLQTKEKKRLTFIYHFLID